MAKSFKHAAESLTRPKAVARQDFFDLLTEATPVAPEPASESRPVSLDQPAEMTTSPQPVPTRPEVTTANLTQAPASGKPRKPRASGNSPLPEVPVLPGADTKPSVSGLSLGPDVRQTFVVSQPLLEQLRDYVHARRAAGDYTYSQKQALEEALVEFFVTRELAQPRPAEVRAREQQFRSRVREGRQSSAPTNSRLGPMQQD